jgi:hypothetical protein
LNTLSRLDETRQESTKQAQDGRVEEEQKPFLLVPGLLVRDINVAGTRLQKAFYFPCRGLGSILPSWQGLHAWKL